MDSWLTYPEYLAQHPGSALTEAEFTPPVIYSNEMRSKLVYLVEARPAAADALKLHPGQPVSVLLP